MGAEPRNAEPLRTIGVEGATITLNLLPPPSSSFFLLIGDITEVNSKDATGKFYCRGVFSDPDAIGLPALVEGTHEPGGTNFVDQRWRIDGQGQIYGCGDEGDPPLLVVGGTGAFKNARGTYVARGMPVPYGDGRFDFAFDLEE